MTKLDHANNVIW